MAYQNLKSYQGALIIYDFTVEFCARYVDRTYGTDKTYHSRMTDQMVQAGRSGKQNIVEGCSQRTSSKSEIKLLGVARASLEELLEDYRDFLRQRKLEVWGKDGAEAKRVRALAYRTDKTYQAYLADARLAANAMICLINQVNFLLDNQIRAAEKDFVEKGGYSEELFRRRLTYRTDKTDKTDKTYN